ncbi:MAG: winged helix-turn-helix transcriptional regulator, partial [archaeon]
VLDDGTVKITGDSDYPDFNKTLTQELTTKKGKYWQFNLNTKDKFDSFYYVVILPKYAEINHLSSKNNPRISTVNNQVRISCFGQDSNINLSVQYSKSNNIFTNNSINYNYVIYLVLIIAIIILFILIISRKDENSLIIKNKETQKENKDKQDNDSKLLDFEMDYLTDRQKDIINILKKDKVATQSYISKKLALPKSSVSRNIESLIKKGIVGKKRYGITNKIVLLKE